MANMGLDELILVEPAVVVGDEARAFAFGAGHVLAGARRVASIAEALAPFQRVVGTTSSRQRVLGATAVGARELPALLASPATIALVFGPESSGLTAEELSHCAIVVHIPCSPVQPTLNLAQAVLIVAYELHLASLVTVEASAAIPTRLLAPTDEVAGLLDHARSILQQAGFDRDTTFDGVLDELRHLAARSALSSREVTLLRGICRRLGHAIGRRPATAE